MGALRKRAGSSISRQPGYICPQCRLSGNRELRVANPSLPSLVRSRYAKNTVKTRLFSTISGPRHLDTHTPTKPLPDALFSGAFRAPTPGQGEPSIRDHLRAWSLRNQAQKEARAEEQFTGQGRITMLPNSLFIDEPKVDDDQFEEDYDFDISSQVLLNPGDLIIHAPKALGGRSKYSIYLGRMGAQYQFFAADGRWVVDRFVDHCSPIIRNFASPEEIEPVLPYLPKKEIVLVEPGMSVEVLKSFAGDVPNAAAATLLHRFAELMEGISTFRRENLHLLDNLYDNLAHAEHYKTFTFNEVVTKTLGGKFSDHSPAAIMAVTFTMQKIPTVIQIWRSSRSEGLYVITTPKRLAERFQLVLGWARDYQEAAAQAARGKNVKFVLESNPLTSFVDKARRIILKSRKIRSPTTTGHLGPSSKQIIEDGAISTQETGEVFSENDKMILEFLWDCYIRGPIEHKVKTKHNCVASLILRAVGAYPKLLLERNIGRLLLQELGVISPWASDLDHNLVYPLPGRRGAEDLDVMIEKAEKYCDKFHWGAEDEYDPKHDTMASLRREFHGTALAVDHASTIIRDDAYSLEPNNDRPGTFWVHVHIAHPTAFCRPDDSLGQLSSKASRSVYTVGEAYHMLPVRFGKALSLQSGGPALTISSLLDENGSVLEVKLQPTILKNVAFLEEAAVSVVANQVTYEKAYMIVGSDSSKTLPENDGFVTAEALRAAQAHSATIHQLKKLMTAREEARRRENPDFADWMANYHDMKVKTLHFGKYKKEQLFESRHYLGDPTIHCSAHRFAQIERIGILEAGAPITEKLMKLAGESAGEWFAQRDIPAAFSCAIAQASYPVARLNKMKYGERRLTPTVLESSSPRPHVVANLKQYLRVTSPLRRFGDMLAHWQADAYLQAEAEALSLNAKVSESIRFPFSKAQIEEHISSAHDYIFAFSSSLGTEELFKLRALFRAFHFKEVDLPEKWDMQMSNVVEQSYRSGAVIPEDSRVRGKLLPFDIQTVLLHSREGWERSAKVTDYLPVKIELVDLSARRILCRAVGPPKKTPHFTGPIRIVPQDLKLE